VLFQVAGDFIDGHPIEACITFISLHPPQCFLQVFSTHMLPPSIDSCWLGFRIHVPPGAIRALPFASWALPAGEDEKSSFALMLLPACRSRDSCTTS